MIRFSRKKHNEHNAVYDELIDLSEMPEKKTKRRHSINREYAFITYGFFVLFLCLAGWFVYYLGFASENFINSPYNPRLSQLSDHIIRGSILASDGTVLAESSVDEADNESRSYPKANEYAHVTGFWEKGMSGIELECNFELLRSHSFILEKIINELKGRKNQGDSIVTTLDTALTDTAYSGMSGYDGAVIAIEPGSGHILTMISKPDFDPNSISANWDTYTASGSGSSVLLNRVTQGQYPPGSTFKIITALEYLKESGRMSDTFDCTGSYTYGDTTIHCYHNIVHGHQTLEDAFGNSCNSVFASIGLGLSASGTEKLAKRLLFNRSLPCDLKNVKKSSFSVSGSDSGLIMQTMIGQGNTLVTPIHMAMIVSALANEGVLMEPSVVDHTQNDGGITVKTFRPKEYGALFGEKETAALKRLMRHAVTDGTASRLNSESYTAYGKTGTAEFSGNKSEAHSWFVGFANNDEKSIAVAIILERAGSGSEHAVPLAKEMFDVFFQ